MSAPVRDTPGLACSCGSPLTAVYDFTVTGCAHCDRPCKVDGCPQCKALNLVRE